LAFSNEPPIMYRRHYCSELYLNIKQMLWALFQWIRDQ